MFFRRRKTLTLVSSALLLICSSCGKKKSNIKQAEQPSDALAVSLALALKDGSLTDQQAQTITDAAKQKAQSKKNAANLNLAGLSLSSGQPDTPAEKEISGFVEGAIAALDEAQIADLEKQKKVLAIVIEIVQKSFEARSQDFGAGLKEMPAIVSDAAVLGLKFSGINRDDYDDALKEMSKKIIDTLVSTGLPPDLRDDAAGLVVSETLGSLDELDIAATDIDSFASLIMATAIDNIPASVMNSDDIKAMVLAMSFAVADGLKDASLSDELVSLALRDVAKASCESIDDIGLDAQLWAGIAEALSDGFVSGLDDAGLARDYYDDAIRGISAGTTEGSKDLNDELTDEQLIELWAAAAKGAAEGLEELGLSLQELDDYVDDIGSGTAEGAETVDLDNDSLKDSLESELGDAVKDGLSDSGLSASELEDIDNQTTTAADGELNDADIGGSASDTGTGNGSSSEFPSGSESPSGSNETLVEQ